MTGLIGGDLIEDFLELRFVFLTRHVTDMRRGDDIGHVRSGWLVSRTGSSSKTSTAAMPGRPALRAATSAPGSISGARLVFTITAVGFMGRIGGGDDAARGVDQPHVQGQHVGLFEKRLFAGGCCVALVAASRVIHTIIL